MYGVHYTSVSFRAIRRAALLALGMRQMNWRWNIEMQIRAAAEHLRVCEIDLSTDRVAAPERAYRESHFGEPSTSTLAEFALSSVLTFRRAS